MQNPTSEYPREIPLVSTFVHTVDASLSLYDPGAHSVQFAIPSAGEEYLRRIVHIV
jgi:hypothetical protein